MGLDDTVNLERIATALAKLAEQFDRYNTLYEKRLDLEHPPERVRREPEIISAETERQAAMSDRPTGDWLRDTEAALPPKSRFEERLDKARLDKGEPPPRPAEPRKRRVAPVPEVH